MQNLAKNQPPYLMPLYLSYKRVQAAAESTFLVPRESAHCVNADVLSSVSGETIANLSENYDT